MILLEANPEGSSVCFGIGMILLLVSLFVVGVGAFIHDSLKRKERKLIKRVREWDEKRVKQLSDFEEQLEAELSRRREELQQQAQVALAKAIKEARDAADTRYRTSLPGGTLEELDERLREVQLGASRTGRVLTVRVLSVPTGWVGIEWMLNPNVVQPLKIVCRRDGKIICDDHGYKGRFGDILARGEEYNYSFQALDGKIDQEDEFQLAVKVPTATQWQRKVNEAKRENAEARERRITGKINMLTGEDELWEKARREAHKRIDQSDGLEFEKRKRKARLDARIGRERDAEEL